MPNHTGLSPQSPNKYLGPNVYLAVEVTRNREPTGADFRQPETGKLYPFGSFWIVGKDPTTGVQGDLWYLSKIVSNVAYWVQLGSGSIGPLLDITVPLGVTPIQPDNTGNIIFTSTGGTVAITGSSASPNNHTINFDLTGGGLGIDEIAVQAVTAPGVSPVTPSGTGLLTFNGTAVAAHSVPIETRSRALNTLSLEVQYASNVASSTASSSGLAHFRTSQFTVDANGFVSLAGGTTSAVKSIVRQVFTASGTYTPTTNMVYADIEVVGGGGGGGGVAASIDATGGGGGGGGYARGVFTAATIGVSQAITIGAAGTAGANTGTDGGTGGTTNVGALISATGGVGGGGAVISEVASGRLGGVGTGGDFQTTGAPGGTGYIDGSGVGGIGGSSFFGGGANNASAGPGGGNVGNAGSSHGGGGGGALVTSGVVGLAGGAGFKGVVIITEYIG